MTCVDIANASRCSQDWLMTSSFIAVRAGYLSDLVWADSGNTIMLNQLFWWLDSHYLLLCFWHTHTHTHTHTQTTILSELHNCKSRRFAFIFSRSLKNKVYICELWKLKTEFMSVLSKNLNRKAFRNQALWGLENALLYTKDDSIIISECLNTSVWGSL
jgi:hypothetical protein